MVCDWPEWSTQLIEIESPGWYLTSTCEMSWAVENRLAADRGDLVRGQASVGCRRPEARVPTIVTPLCCRPGCCPGCRRSHRSRWRTPEAAEPSGLPRSRRSRWTPEPPKPLLEPSLAGWVSTPRKAVAPRWTVGRWRCRPRSAWRWTAPR